MKQRLHYFDMLKGMAIFLVVMGHVLTMCVREIDRAAIFKFIGEIHMPLFFFISGWFTYRLTKDTGAVRRPDLWKRAVQLLVPMAVVSSLWIWYFPHSGLQSPLNSTFDGLWHDEWKNGYWFTLVLMEIIIVYAAVCPLLNKLKNLWAQVALTIVIWAVLMVVALVIGAEWTGITSLGLAARLWPVFMAGAIARAHSEGFAKVTSPGAWTTISTIVGAVLLYLICWPWEFSWLSGEHGEVLLSVCRSLFHICIAVVAIAAVKPWSERVYVEGIGSKRIANTWCLLGRQSLAIYLLHYFFLFPLGVCRPALESMGLDLTPLAVFSGVVAVAVVALTLGVTVIIERSPLLSKILIGK